MLKFNVSFRLREWLHFYGSALTKFQLHSPFIYDLAQAVLENRRFYYAFRDVEVLRHKMLLSEATLNVRDLGTGAGGPKALRDIARRASSSAGQGRMLFRLADWRQPATILELGTSVGIGTAYLTAGARQARLISLEGCPETAAVARMNLSLLQLEKGAEVRTGAFEDTLPGALQELKTLDFVYFDGNHRKPATLAYFRQCLAYASARALFVFDDVHHSREMAEAWQEIRQDPRISLTVDFFDLSLAFVYPEFEVKQHLNVVPSRWKFWKVF